ncbi:DHA2 family lincomycin resistance protein-like MFS transporter [Rhodococcus sp. LBL1]|nr:DHA2 family lincomycin resistance protein-like MFS transporter [Rhodococcus sp. LBL1]MDH6684422.1 DHA2 family lincomycin resistance protein-like MFS transporter [Rhodococcus sp. LBL2]
MSEPITVTATATATAAGIDPRARLALGILVAATFVVILNETVMTVALPTLIHDLSITESTGQWLTTAFMLTTAVVIPTTGWMMQRFPTKGVYVAAMTLFTVGTVLAAVAPGFEILLAARIVQAAGTALMMPLLFTTVLELVPDERRGAVMGLSAIVTSVAPALGPTLSGVMLQLYGWRSMFLVVTPFAIAALGAGAMLIPTVNTPRRIPLDTGSVALAVLGFGGLVYGLNEIGLVATGHAPAWVAWAPLTVAGVALIAFIVRQIHLQSRDAALLDMRVFRARTFTVSMLIVVVSMIGLFGTLTLLPLFLKNVLGADPVAIGLVVLPGGLVMGLLGPVVGRIYDRTGPRPILLCGSVIASVSLWALALSISPDLPLATIVALHIALSVGLAMLFTPLFTAGLSAVPTPLYPQGSAILGTVQQVAGAMGVAVLVTVLAAYAGDTSRGINDLAAYGAGIEAAFLIGAALSLVSIPLSLLVNRNSEEPAL